MPPISRIAKRVTFARSKPSASGDELGRPPRCYSRHVSFSATGCVARQNRLLRQVRLPQCTRLAAAVFVGTDRAKVLPTDLLVQDAGLRRGGAPPAASLHRERSQ